MTRVEPTETEELCGRVLGIIGAYGLGDCNPREPYLKTTPTAAPPEIVPRARRHEAAAAGGTRHLGSEAAVTLLVGRHTRRARGPAAGNGIVAGPLR